MTTWSVLILFFAFVIRIHGDELKVHPLPQRRHGRSFHWHVLPKYVRAGVSRGSVSLSPLHHFWRTQRYICHDRDARCVKWARSGFCSVYPNKMQKYCGATCGFCGFLKPCFDDFRVAEFCVHWAHHGACQSDPIYMRKRCARSCRFCHLDDFMHAKVRHHDERREERLGQLKGTSARLSGAHDEDGEVAGVKEEEGNVEEVNEDENVGGVDEREGNVIGDA